MKRYLIMTAAFVPAIAWATGAVAAPVEVGWLTASAGKVEMKLPGGKAWAPLKESDAIVQGGGIRTGKDSRARLLMKDQSVLMLGESSELELNDYTVTPEKQTTLVTMFKGKLLAAIAKLTTSKSRYEIRTPTAVAGVRGTYLGLDVSDDEGKTELWVLAGLVNLKNLLEMGSQGTDVHEMHMTRVMPGVAPIPPSAIDPEKVKSFIAELKKPLMARISTDTDIKVMLADALVPATLPQAQGRQEMGTVFTTKAGAVLPPVRQEKSQKAEDVKVLIKIGMPNAQ